MHNFGQDGDNGNHRCWDGGYSGDGWIYGGDEVQLGMPKIVTTDKDSIGKSSRYAGKLR